MLRRSHIHNEWNEPDITKAWSDIQKSWFYMPTTCDTIEGLKLDSLHKIFGESLQDALLLDVGVLAL